MAKHIGSENETTSQMNPSNASGSDLDVPQTHAELETERRHEIEQIVSHIEEEAAQLTDSEDEDEFIKKYGEVQFQYIRRPKTTPWFIRPHALNYFKDGVLYRTKGERSSSKTELFLDLMYVGIIANLAGHASEHASGSSLLKYVLLFVPAWTVWADIKDFTNYYYNEDLSQKTYILWILALLTLYVNSSSEVLNGVKGAAYVVVPYILCRMSLSISLLVYSLYIPEHRPQMRAYAATIIVTCSIWIAVIFVDTRAKIGLSIAIMVIENLCFCFCYSPQFKKLLKITTSTALNLEHEVERMSTFVTIALGEFLYKVIADSPLGPFFSAKFARGIFMIIIAYNLFWIYNNGSMSTRATHSLRRKAWSAILWIYVHVPMIASLVLAADAGGEITALDITKLAKKKHTLSELLEQTTDEKRSLIIRAAFTFIRETSEALAESEEEEPNMYALSLFFTGSLCVALICMAIMGFTDKLHELKGEFLVSRFFRVIPRVPIAIIILCLSFKEMDSTLLFGMVALLTSVLLVWENVVGVPLKSYSACSQ